MKKSPKRNAAVLLVESNLYGHGFQNALAMARYFLGRDARVCMLLPEYHRELPEAGEIPADVTILSAGPRTRQRIGKWSFTHFRILWRALVNCRRLAIPRILFLTVDNYFYYLTAFLAKMLVPMLLLRLRVSIVQYRIGHMVHSEKKSSLDRVKKLVQRFFLALPTVDHVFVLDPRLFSQSKRSRKFHFMVETDIEQSAFPAQARARKEMGWQEDLFYIVSLGTQYWRKGSLWLVRALAHLPRPVRDQVRIVLAGRFIPAYRTAIMEFASRENLESQLIIQDHYIPTSELTAMFAGCDGVALPYPRSFRSSSGILFKGVRAGKPILGPEHGVIGHYIEKHRIGWTFNAEDPPSIAQAMMRLVEADPGEIQRIHANCLDLARDFSTQAFYAELDKAFFPAT